MEIGLSVSEKKSFEGLLPYIWAWRPSWSFDQHCVNSIQFNSILYSDCQIHFSASTKHLINDKLPKQIHYTILLLHISKGILVMDTGRQEWTGNGGKLVQCQEQFYS